MLKLSLLLQSSAKEDELIVLDSMLFISYISVKTEIKEANR